MNLKSYREKHHLTQDDVARKIKKHVTTVCKYETGDTMPSLKAMDDIWKLTGGEVTMRDFIRQHTQRVKERRNGENSEKTNGNGADKASTAAV